MAKTGPKPLEGEEYFKKCCERHWNSRLLEVIGTRHYRVECLACYEERAINLEDGSEPRNPKHKCFCSKKKFSNGTIYTPELLTAKMRRDGVLEYECLSCSGNSREVERGRNRYRHKCGNEFEMSHACFRECITPCDKCRNLAMEFEIGGRRFTVRSNPEKQFIEKCFKEDPSVIDEIVYEPKSEVIQYFNPVKNRISSYYPDFKVRNTVFEIKDLGTLGLLNRKKHLYGKSMDQIVIENRAKFEAANKEFADYKMLVFIKGEFHLVGKFWEAAEKDRLRKLAKYSEKNL